MSKINFLMIMFKKKYIYIYIYIYIYATTRRLHDEMQGKHNM
jgi:hypothetical protein